MRGLFGLSSSLVRRPFAARLFSTTGARPATRRRGGQSGSPVSSVSFTVEVQKVLKQIYDGLNEGIIPLNSTYKLSWAKEGEKVTMDANEKGFYVFSADWNNELLTVQTPISGVRQYEFEPMEKTWLNTVDQHDMRGLVTRDLLRHARGVCKF